MCSRLSVREKFLVFNQPNFQLSLFRIEWQPPSISSAQGPIYRNVVIPNERGVVERQRGVLRARPGRVMGIRSFPALTKFTPLLPLKKVADGICFLPLQAI
jgi:hypothetical protein